MDVENCFSLTQYPNTPSSRKRSIRRSISFNYIIPDYFELLKIPNNVIEYIFGYLDLPDLVNVMGTCRRFNRIGKSPKFWRVLDLSNVRISQFALHKTLERKTAMICLTSSNLFNDHLNYWCIDMLDKLIYLDLSYARYTSDASILQSLLNRTTNLQYLNIAQFSAISEQLCESISKNKCLKYLNMEMCETFSVKSLFIILSSCNNLLELNLSWGKLVPNALKLACQQLPIGLERLNFAGMNKNLTNDCVEMIVNRCKNLVEADFSDCGITEAALTSLNKLEYLEKLSVSRCHEIDPIFFADVENLKELNVYGNVTNEGVDFLRQRLNPTHVNVDCLSTIARISLERFQRLPK